MYADASLDLKIAFLSKKKVFYDIYRTSLYAFTVKMQIEWNLIYPLKIDYRRRKLNNAKTRKKGTRVSIHWPIIKISFVLYSILYFLYRIYFTFIREQVEKKTSVSWILNALQLLSNDASKITEVVHKKRMAAN